MQHFFVAGSYPGGGGGGSGGSAEPTLQIKGRLKWNFRKNFFLAKYIHYEVLNTKYFFEIFPAFLLFKIGS